jgi:myo-inositol 2-dehydrogenase/D-chiro-inositol 1-dehydrogenase
LAKQCNARVFDTIEAMLPHVDVVDICTPTDLHLDQALAAFAAGRHVVCEKPLARTVPQAQAMVDAAHNAGRQLLVAHVVRYFERYVDARRRVLAGEVGRLKSVFLARRGTRPDTAARAWFADEARSGGVALDLMIHDFDYARWLCGEVIAVQAERSGELAVSAVLTHANGVTSHIEGRWDSPTFQTEAAIAAETGVIGFDNSTRELVDPYAAQAQEFYAAIADGKVPRISAHDGVAALQIALAVLESARTGKQAAL